MRDLSGAQRQSRAPFYFEGVSMVRFSGGCGGAPGGCSDSSSWKGRRRSWRSLVSVGASSITCQFFPTGTTSIFLGTTGGCAGLAASWAAHAQQRKKQALSITAAMYLMALLLAYPEAASHSGACSFRADKHTKMSAQLTVMALQPVLCQLPDRNFQ
jgi:hypothetical protein